MKTVEIEFREASQSVTSFKIKKRIMFMLARSCQNPCSSNRIRKKRWGSFKIQKIYLYIYIYNLINHVELFAIKVQIECCSRFLILVSLSDGHGDIHSPWLKSQACCWFPQLFWRRQLYLHIAWNLSKTCKYTELYKSNWLENVILLKDLKLKNNKHNCNKSLRY